MSETGPTFSIIIPTYRRPEALRRCLGAVAALDYPRERFEVVVVDDGSPTPPRAVIRELSQTLPLRLLEQRNAGPASARNHGAAHAVGRYLAFTDDDCLPAPQWLASLERELTAAPRAAIGGHIENALASDAYASASQMLVEYLYEYYHVEGAKGRFFTTSNFALPRSAFAVLGGFDTTFPLAAAEDREFCERWVAHGYELRFAEDAVVYHAHLLSFGSFWRQHFGYGRGAVFLHRARQARGNGAVRLEPLRFYANLVRYPMRRGVRRVTLRDSALMMLSQLAYGSGYYWERLRQRVGVTRSD
jgi:glycosyltransferase involved in cell wall biosynthesis